MSDAAAKVADMSDEQIDDEIRSVLAVAGPLFQPTMTVLDGYHYGILHFDHHRHQLS
jgi:hypothetical protein